jgi:hypothetical protein
MSAFGDLKGIWIRDIMKLPGGLIFYTGYILMRPSKLLMAMIGHLLACRSTSLDKGSKIIE